MAVSRKAREITDTLYTWYGSHTGYLFGLSPALRHAVEAIVQCVLDQIEDVEKDERSNEDDW